MMTKEDVMVFAEAFYDLKCNYYRVALHHKNTKNEINEYLVWNAMANKIKYLVGFSIFHHVATKQQQTILALFNDIESMAMDKEKEYENKDEETPHWLGELDDIFKKYGFMDEEEQENGQ
ncbi:MAG: hypothetical protein LKG17_07570 [Megasphaera sp.]|nr:hypothetical protein [Megasphaera sp.]